MPGLNRTGPMGEGPMTGGRRGLCGSGAGIPDPYAYGGGYGYGRGMGFRRGFGGGRGRMAGRGFGSGVAPAAVGRNYSMSKADEMAMLRADADAMKNSLDAILQRIADLEKEGTE
jgi:hypothetical protein